FGFEIPRDLGAIWRQRESPTDISCKVSTAREGRMPDFAPSVLPSVGDYDALCRSFRWQIPATFNIAVAVCDRRAGGEPQRTAIIHQHPDGRVDAVSYGALREVSNRLANVLRAYGIARGDRVALMLPQMPEVAAIHVAIYKLGAIALPLAALFGPDA